MEQGEEKQNSVSWRGYEYEHREKTRDWYYVLAIISISAAIAAVFFQNFLFAVLVIVAAFSIAVHAAHKPELKDFRIDGRGIKIGSKFYSYENIDSFWLKTGEKNSELFIELKRAVLPLIILPVDNQSSDEAKDILSSYLPEKEQMIPFTQTITDFFGF